jgi:hypothetical protein
MYCPTCGLENTMGLNYCKRCGANLARPELSKVSGAFWAVAIFGIASIGILLASLIVLVAIGLNKEGILVPITVFGSLTIFAVAALLIRQMSQLISLAQGSNRPAGSHWKWHHFWGSLIRSNRPAVPAKETMIPSQLPTRPETIPSVTEHTTRKFEQSQYEEPMHGGADECVRQ